MNNQRKKKILIFDLGSRLGSVGGAERVAAFLFSGLRKYGFNTYYLGYGNEYLPRDKNVFVLGDVKQKQVKNAVERHKLRGLLSSRVVRLLYYTFYSLHASNAGEIKRRITEIDPDVIISNSILDFMILKKIRGIKIVYVDHANASGEYKNSFDPHVQPLAFGTGVPIGLERSKRRFFKLFDVVVALNLRQEESLRKYNKNVVVIPNGMLLEKSQIEKAKLDAIKDKIGIGKNGRVVLYVGRFDEKQKNVSTLIKAFKKMADSSLKLVLVGDGKSMQMYRALAEGSSSILFAGRVSEEELPYYYSMADLYVIPSRWESFNLSIIEAASFGVPLLLSKNAVPKDFESEFDGRLFTFDPENIEELKDKMEEFFASAGLQERLKALSDDISREYSKERQLSRYVEMLKKLGEA